MNRSDRKTLAEKTLSILSNGSYTSLSGNRVDISAQQEFAVANTKLYTTEESNELLNSYEPDNTNRVTSYRVINQTTLEGVFELLKEGHEKVMCLNFASAKNPGGGFLGGSQAQEESLARSTGLYPCQLEASEYYRFNKSVGNTFYSDYMIFSPSVPILRNDSGELLDSLSTCSILTAPAVNRGALPKRGIKLEADIKEVMIRRIRKVLAIALENNQTALVLGAWGCGVFQNKPKDIASYFKLVLDTEFKNQFDIIVFSIYSKGDSFILPFQQNFIS